MENLPVYIPMVFGITVLAALLLFYKAAGNSRRFLLLALAWIVLQTILGLEGFYLVQGGPPRFALLAMPPVLLGIIYFSTRAGKAFLSGLDPKLLLVIHMLRIVVEVVLYWLFVNHAVPKAMTFEGRNFDILSGLTAVLIYYFGYIKKTLSRTVMITWNVVCIGLLLNVVSMGVSTALKFTGSISNDLAIMHFPFVLLPGFLVPLVLFSNVALIFQAKRTGLFNKARIAD